MPIRALHGRLSLFNFMRGIRGGAVLPTCLLIAPSINIVLQYRSLMDLKAHEQALQNIRNKYAQPNAVLREKQNPAAAKTLTRKHSNDLFKTPTKTARKEEGSGKIRPVELQMLHAQPLVPPKVGQGQSAAENVQTILSRKLAFAKAKGRGFEEILAERDKQLTERVERNRQLLSKSKEVRERESRNGSVEEGNRTDRTGREGQAELDQLRLILKDRNYALVDKAGSQKKPAGIGLHSAKDENLYSSIKKSFTDKMKQNLAQTFGSSKPSQAKANEQREKRWQISREAENSSKDVGKFQKKKQISLIKTPIPPPKQSSPSKISSIFQNTQKIEERIHALLSR